MNQSDRAKLVSAWIEFEKTDRKDVKRCDELFWSFDVLSGLTRNDPDAAFDVILSILAADDSDVIEANLAAGPLEDLLGYHGPAYIDRIEGEAARNPRFRHLLGGVWQNAMTDEVWVRVQACWDRRGWDGIPE